MINSGSPSSPLNGVNQDDGQDENDMVDYDEEDDQDFFTRSESDKTTSAKTFGDNHTGKINRLITPSLRILVRWAMKISHKASQLRTILKGNQRRESHEVNAHEGAQEPAEIKADTLVAKPVLTQRGIMDIISRQPQALMQKMKWEQKAVLQGVAERVRKP